MRERYRELFKPADLRGRFYTDRARKSGRSWRRGGVRQLLLTQRGDRGETSDLFVFDVARAVCVSSGSKLALCLFLAVPQWCMDGWYSSRKYLHFLLYNLVEPTILIKKRNNNNRMEMRSGTKNLQRSQNPSCQNVMHASKEEDNNKCYIVHWCVPGSERDWTRNVHQTFFFSTHISNFANILK